MSVTAPPPVRAADETAATLAPDAGLVGPRSRRVIAAPAGLALLLAGGALLVRVAVLTVAGQGAAQNTWLFTAAACVLAGLALVLIALPRLGSSSRDEADKPDPALPRG